MYSLNFDLQLQFTEYLYKNYRDIFDVLLKIDKTFYPAILYVLRKNRPKKMELARSLFNVFKHFNKIFYIELLTSIDKLDEFLRYVFDDDNNIDIDWQNIEDSVFDLLLNYDVNSVFDILNGIELFSIEKDYIYKLIDDANIGFEKCGRDMFYEFDSYYSILRDMVYYRDLELARNYGKFLGGIELFNPEDYTDLKQVADETNDPVMINFVYNELPTYDL